jgi:hypothetical protein
MTQKGQQTFVYGTFLWPGRKRESGAFYGLSGMPPGAPDIAIEILREFSATEFVGKMYTKLSVGDWAVAQFQKIRQTPWFEAFDKSPKMVVFDMQGSGPWEILHFRAESDESGGYTAIALRQFETAKTPPWVKGLRTLLTRTLGT